MQIEARMAGSIVLVPVSATHNNSDDDHDELATATCSGNRLCWLAS